MTLQHHPPLSHRLHYLGAYPLHLPDIDSGCIAGSVMMRLNAAARFAVVKGRLDSLGQKPARNLRLLNSANYNADIFLPQLAFAMERMLPKSRDIELRRSEYRLVQGGGNRHTVPLNSVIDAQNNLLEMIPTEIPPIHESHQDALNFLSYNLINYS